MTIITCFLFFVKQFVLAEHFFKIFIAQAVKGHYGILRMPVAVLQHQPDYHVQVRVRQSANHENGAGVAHILDNHIRGYNHARCIFMKQQKIFSVPFLDMFQPFSSYDYI